MAVRANSRVFFISYELFILFIVLKSRLIRCCSGMLGDDLICELDVAIAKVLSDDLEMTGCEFWLLVRNRLLRRGYSLVVM